MDFSFSDLNYNSVETLPGFEPRAAFTVNSSSVFKEDVDIVPTIVDYTPSPPPSQPNALTQPHRQGVQVPEGPGCGYPRLSFRPWRSYGAEVRR